MPCSAPKPTERSNEQKYFVCISQILLDEADKARSYSFILFISKIFIAHSGKLVDQGGALILEVGHDYFVDRPVTSQQTINKPSPDIVGEPIIVEKILYIKKITRMLSVQGRADLPTVKLCQRNYWNGHKRLKVRLRFRA
jgi:hypothetical protein